MTQLIDMQALRDFSHEGVSYARDQRFTVEPLHAAALNFSRHARLIEPGEIVIEPALPVVVKDLVPETIPKSTRTRRPRARKTYNRRDLAPAQTK